MKLKLLNLKPQNIEIHVHVPVNKTVHCRSINLVSHLQFPKGFFLFRVRYTIDSEKQQLFKQGLKYKQN